MESRRSAKCTLDIKQQYEFLAWGVTLKIFAATGITTGIILHFIGTVSHEIYLAQWGIAASQFPKSADWVSTNGYFTLFSRLASSFFSLKTNWINVWEFWATMTLVVVYIIFLIFINKKIDSNESIGRWVASRTRFSRLSLQVLFLGTLLSVVVSCGIFLATSVMSLPALIGSEQGKFQAASDLQKFKKGCLEDTQATECIELKKEGSVIAKGFIIDSSESRIALFDVALQRVRVLELQGLEILSTPMIIGSTEK